MCAQHSVRVCSFCSFRRKVGERFVRTVRFLIVRLVCVELSLKQIKMSEFLLSLISRRLVYIFYESEEHASGAHTFCRQIMCLHYN